MLPCFLYGLLAMSVMGGADSAHAQSITVPGVVRRYSFRDDGFEDIVPVSGIQTIPGEFKASLRIRGRIHPSKVRCQAPDGEWHVVQNWPVLIIWGRIQGWTFSTAVAAEDSVFATTLDVVDTRQESRYGPGDLFWPERNNVLKVYIVPRQDVYHPSCEWVRSDPYYELDDFTVVLESLAED